MWSAEYLEMDTRSFRPLHTEDHIRYRQLRVGTRREGFARHDVYAPKWPLLWRFQRLA